MARRATIHKIKAHRVYTIDEAALCVGVTAQTMRRWAGEGLRVMSQRRPHLILARLQSYCNNRPPTPSKPISIASAWYSGKSVTSHFLEILKKGSVKIAASDGGDGFAAVAANKGNETIDVNSAKGIKPEQE